MQEFVADAFNLTGLIPHGFCLKWNPFLLWTLVSSDAVITVSYFSIPFALWFFAKKRPDVRHRGLFVLFGLFIIACGITHLLDVLIIWHPNYWLTALAKAITAVISFSAATVLWLIMPNALRMPSAQQLQQAKSALERLNLELEDRVRDRTRELEFSNAQLQAALNELRALNQQIHREKTLLRGLLDNIPDYIFIKDTDSVYIACNKAVEAYFGAPESRIVGKTDFDFVDAETAKSFRRIDQEMLARGELITTEEMITHPDGQQFYLETLKTPFRDNEGRILGLIGVGRNITERKQVEIKLELAAKVFTHAREGIMITDADAIVIEVNDTFTQITGYSREEAIGRSPRILQSGRHTQEFYAAMWNALLSEGYWCGEVWNRHKSGRVYAEMITISAVKDSQGKIQNFVGLFTDITQMKEHQMQLEYIAHYDALTQLPNRLLLTDRLQQAILNNDRHQNILAVIYLDLDGFKAVNDNYDHKIGDELLIAVSKRMKEALREGDTLSRIGGDEFVAVLIDLEHSKACEPILTRLLHAAAAPISINGIELQVSSSIGVTFYPQDNVDADQLIRHADQSMYIAKQKGKNRYHLFDVEQDAAIKTQQQQLEEIQHALYRREFELHYQPKVNLLTGLVIGVEALIRWRHPERGLLLPHDFLPVTETQPLSVELGEWVLAAALSQIRAWRAQGIDLPVSVNVGARQFQQTNFVARLEKLLSAYPDIPANRLELEILETSALGDLAVVSEKIKACQALGLRFALDDFGTGFSSLTYLRHLPVDTLKIDQTFVRDMLNDEDDLAIVNSVIGLAHTFKRKVIAEGVETPQHAEKLLSLGCELAQGYGIAKPMPATELAAWLHDWTVAKLWANRR
jgi:diguanylate cyclase (GGDEF)-like protein/PAS domain S-box-containing protein